MSFTIEIDDVEVRSALGRLHEKTANLRPVLLALGEDVVARTKARFGRLEAPDGTPWAPNSPATITAYLSRRGLKGAKAQASVAAKRPLHGESGDLARQFFVQADNAGVTISSSPVYAAIQQFGGQAGRGRRVTIPPRPFLPVTASGELYPQERDQIERTILDHLQAI